MLPQLNLCPMRLNLNTTSKYFEEVVTLDELEANTLK